MCSLYISQLSAIHGMRYVSLQKRHSSIMENMIDESTNHFVTIKFVICTLLLHPFVCTCVCVHV